MRVQEALNHPSDEEMRENSTDIPSRTLDVVCTDPDGQPEYSWTIFFWGVTIYVHTRVIGPILQLMVVDLTGTNANIDIDELRTGTKK